MIKIKNLLFALSIATPLMAQSNPDSLIEVIRNNAKDSIILTKIFEKLSPTTEYKDSIYDKVVIEFIKSSASNGWANGVAKGNDLAGNRYYARGNFSKAQEYFQNIIVLSQKTKIPVAIIANAYKMLAGILFNTGNAEGAIEKANNAIDLFQQINDTLSLQRL